jgi:hypothetical protein
MTLKISIQNEMLCGSALFSLLKKFIGKLEDLCGQAGVCSVANIELGETCEEQGRTLKMARFDLRLSNDEIVQVAASAKTLEDAILNAFDHCERRISSLLETRV